MMDMQIVFKSLGCAEKNHFKAFLLAIDSGERKAASQWEPAAIGTSGC